MKISLNWLRKYVDLGALPTDEIISKLNMSGLEVESIEDQTTIYKDFIVGFVKDRKKHPNADKLSLCTVDTGTEDLQVICGATNVEAGEKVVFAPIGTLIPKGNFKITKAKIRGVESWGMICAEDELELSEDHSGIMILDNSLQQGTPITKALNLNDTILEIAITPNRPDALSHIGTARDLAAIFNVNLILPKIDVCPAKKNINSEAAVEIKDTLNCPRYSASVLKGITIKESPEWLKEKLKNIGLRPINNVVDITNFVMYETGQPLHAFDLDYLQGKKIIVQSTVDETIFKTLDSKERKLPAGTLMICDSRKPIAIAGIMGGENSEINNSTMNILIESAYFNPANIRKSSKAIGLSTDASYRFERGIDPNGTLYSVQRAAQLINEIAGGEILDGVIDLYPNKITEKEVELRYDRISKILGYKIPNDNIKQILNSLGFKISAEFNSSIKVQIPTYRPDVEREIDLIEEVARIYGYDKIPAISKISISLGQKFDELEFIDKIKDVAISLGFYEIINNPLQGFSTASLIGNKINILNPQSEDMSFLRTSLIPGALSVVSKNISNSEKDLALFEVGNVFNKKPEVSVISSFDDFCESQKLIFVITGQVSQKHWNYPEKLYDFFDLKGLINSFIMKISLDNVLNDSYYHSAESIYDYTFSKINQKSIIGIGGSIRKEVLKQFGINQSVFCFEFDIDELKKVPLKEKYYKELLKFPKVKRDFAFIFNKNILHEEVVNFINSSGSKLLKSVELFDLFEHESLGLDKKSMAFALEYYSEQRTLTEQEVEKEFLSLISAITKKFDAKLRGN